MHSLQPAPRATGVVIQRSGMDLIELGSTLGTFFDPEFGMVGPSHDQITHAVGRADLSAGDPRGTSDTAGKMKRVREVLLYATDHEPDAGLRFVEHVVSLLRACSRFVPTQPGYAGEQRITALREALGRVGYDLASDGTMQPLVIDSLEGRELSEALQSYIRRINLNPNDAALIVGTGKELDEATARHVLQERTGTYSATGNFPVTLSQAFTALGMAIPTSTLVQSLDPDPRKQVEECLFLLACSVNRLRHEAGTGHGRPGVAPLTGEEARLVAKTTAVVASAMLDRL